ncbi:SLAP domain-containing protein [Lactobacillus amylovorus]|uniref:SLAP domain-containing protein n=1 Tax=Lactobacillus amylovorus TaxID=1604 RepID=UPI00232BE092|nr:SLAP domain-containing protein [Lactobacillus amylovorus]MDB6243538.1 SLAP domain-containing protein [Lactobacillus amylovorus]
MFNNKKSLVKLTAGIGLSTALLLGGSVTSNVFPSSTVEAASSYKVTLRHNAYVYNYKGYRIRKASLKKGKILKVYRSKNINGKKYLYIGKHQYIKSANASKYNSKATKVSAKAYLFTVKVNPGSDLYTAPNGDLSNWSMENTQRVYAVTTDSKGETWYKLAKNNWIKSTDTNKPQNNTATITNKSSSNQAVSNSKNQTNEEKSKTNNSPTSKPKITNVQTLATPQYASEIAQSFITQLNEVRQKMGKGTLSLDANINDFANIRSNELLTKFSHVRPDGSSFNYSECISMEMIDKNTTPSQAAKKVLDRFLYDDASWNWGHRNALLDSDCKKIGVGVSWEPKPGTSWNNYRFPEYMGFRMAVEMK